MVYLLSPLTGVPLIPQSELVAHPLQFNPITCSLLEIQKESHYVSLRQRESISPYHSEIAIHHQRIGQNRARARKEKKNKEIACRFC